MNLREWPSLPGGQRTTQAVCTYSADANGGTFDERKEFKSGYESSVGIFSAKFDEHRQIETIDFTYKGKGQYPAGSLNEAFNIKVINQGDKIRISSDWPFVFYDSGQPTKVLEIAAPSDGFFDFSGSDSPSSMAVMLSAVDLDGDEPAEVWAFGLQGLTIGPGVLQVITGTDSLFTRFKITSLEKCSDRAKEWWEKSRKYYDNWRPPENWKTYIFEGDAENFYGYLDSPDYSYIRMETDDIYSPHGPWVAAYLNEEGLLVRIEQPTDIESPLTTLSHLGGEEAWWTEKEQS